MTPTPTWEVSSPSVLKELLRRHQFSLKKQLGQNFLINANTLRAIVEAADVTEADGAFEIGPGAGVVTRMLAARARKVVAVEKDKALQPVLADSLAGAENVELVFADVLDVDLSALWAAFAGCERVSVVANLPYYVTTPILFHILESNVPVSDIVVMVQKEVADRLCASPGGKDYGALTVAVQYRADVERVTRVSPACFLPPPNVESTVIRMKCRPPLVEVDDEKSFRRVVRAAFATRRKTLGNALSAQLGIDKERCKALLANVHIDGNRRGETLSIAEFAAISNAFHRDVFSS